MCCRIPTYRWSASITLALCVCCVVSGCQIAQLVSAQSVLHQADDSLATSGTDTEPDDSSADVVRQAGFQQPADPAAAEQPPQVPPPAPDLDAAGSDAKDSEVAKPESSDAVETLHLDHIMNSILASYPLLRAAEQERMIAEGNQYSAWGEFDLKLKAESLNGPTGFYQTYRQSAGIEQPVFDTGGTVFGGYRVGRGDYQPWYLERQTNNGGEFKAGFIMPLARNRDIDARRAGVWLATYDIEKADPFISMQLIAFIRAGTLAYWDWVAAGRQVLIARNLLEFAEKRQAGLKKRVDEGDLPRIELTDNERMIVSRQTKLIDAERKLRQSAVKLSLFWRTPTGEPLLPTDEQLPAAFPLVQSYDEAAMEADIARAIQQRPELRLLDVQQRQLEVQMSQAGNDMEPSLDFTVTGSQDVGQATSKKRDKSEFELEAGVIFQVPVQRRKARGKLAALEGKLSQVRAKSKFTRDKVSAEVQAAVAGLLAASRQTTAAEKSLALTRTMEQAERTRFAAGAADSNLLSVNIREQASADAAAVVLDAQQKFFQALADFEAATADSVTQRSFDP